MFQTKTILKVQSPRMHLKDNGTDLQSSGGFTSGAPRSSEARSGSSRVPQAALRAASSSRPPARLVLGFPAPGAASTTSPVASSAPGPSCSPRPLLQTLTAQTRALRAAWLGRGCPCGRPPSPASARPPAAPPRGKTPPYAFVFPAAGPAPAPPRPSGVC